MCWCKHRVLVAWQIGLGCTKRSRAPQEENLSPTARRGHINGDDTGLTNKKHACPGVVVVKHQAQEGLGDMQLKMTGTISTCKERSKG